MDRDWVIAVDTREKKPLPFPEHLVLTAPDLSLTTVKVHIVQKKLETADYSLDSHPSQVMIERKGCIDEVCSNMLRKDERARFENALQRLSAACKRPYVFLEGTPYNLKRPHYQDRGVEGLDEFQRVLVQYGIGMLLMPTATISARREAAEFVARLLINGAIVYG